MIDKIGTCTGLALLAMALAGCGTLRRDEAGALQGTKEIAALIKSAGDNAALFQGQRDAIAKASQRQRDALDAAASRQELELAELTAAWHIAGDNRRKTMFEAVRSEADTLAGLRAKRSETARQQAETLDKIRSEVRFNAAKISEAAVNLIQLAEPPTDAAERAFLLDFLKAVNADVKKDQEAEIAAQAKQALTNPKEADHD